MLPDSRALLNKAEQRLAHLDVPPLVRHALIEGEVNFWCQPEETLAGGIPRVLLYKDGQNQGFTECRFLNG